ncbi:hypothetical protein AU196_14280 [Mycobacterium sp. IS-1742]|uniref:SRPBCC family protein n=1 Tax=Mycobacterium sp. IS-1742 TaxID=1772285 RepID=UPI00073FFDCC|nr:SRPBCC family protein [Mycobacterium sp. IS-1742]KUI30676.1 hypothetical protein AU196_14280 [Mycobacterium sp. IS-1742]
MPDVTASIIIAHPAQVVWDYIIHPDHLRNVLPGIVSVDPGKEPPYAPGDVWHGVSRSLGVTNPWTGVFERVDAPTMMQFRITESRFPVTTIDTLDEVEGGTRYTCRITGEPILGGAVGRLFDAVVSRVMQRAMASQQAKLPAHVDAWARQKG